MLAKKTFLWNKSLISHRKLLCRIMRASDCRNFSTLLRGHFLQDPIVVRSMWIRCIACMKLLMYMHSSYNCWCPCWATSIIYKDNSGINQTDPSVIFKLNHLTSIQIKAQLNEMLVQTCSSSLLIISLSTKRSQWKHALQWNKSVETDVGWNTTAAASN